MVLFVFNDFIRYFKWICLIVYGSVWFRFVFFILMKVILVGIIWNNVMLLIEILLVVVVSVVIKVIIFGFIIKDVLFKRFFYCWCNEILMKYFFILL